MRSLCHELVHHSQNVTDPQGFMAVRKGGRLEENPELERLESDAFTRGNLTFRKWTESKVGRRT